MDKLNKQQQKAVKSNKNVTLVIAGAGSGKTTVLTKRIEYLMTEKDASQGDILAITFTNKAANEMKTRLCENLGPYASSIWVLTFHSFGVRVIRNNLDYLPNHNHNFIIIDDTDKKRILKNILIKLRLNEIYKVPQVLWAINKAKTFSMTHKEASNNIDFEFMEVFNEYETYLKSNNAMDFDDLLIYTFELLSIKEVCKKYQKQFKHILVDEYQDTSSVQDKILLTIKKKTTSLFIVGDVDQSIYGWRGAIVENIIKVEKNFKDCQVIKLEQNYRSTQNILDSANVLIGYNKNRYDKNLWTDSPPGEKIKAHRFETPTKEAAFVEKEIKYLLDFNKKKKTMAVLYRYNYQSKKIEEALIRSSIPYIIYGGIKFYERAEIKDMIAYLRIIYNHDDNISFMRIVNTPKRSIGDVTLKKITNLALEQNSSYYDAAKSLELKSLTKFFLLLEAAKPNFEQDFLNHFNNFLEELEYKTYLSTNDDADKVDERMDNIIELRNSIIEAIASSKSIAEYLIELQLFSEVGADDQAPVILSTIHGVKGLEFDYVFLIGVNEGKFPKFSFQITDEELEEERRVAYVAVTRAKTKLVISNISFDFSGIYYEDSRFIEEMGVLETTEKLDGFIF